MKCYIGIDFGLARIGLSKADSSFKIAMPYKIVKAGKTLQESVDNIEKELFFFLQDIVEIIVGHPLYSSGKKSPMTETVETFANLLSSKLKIPVKLWDERLTSKQAEKSLIEANMSRKARAKVSDFLAAMIILQSYLDAAVK